VDRVLRMVGADGDELVQDLFLCSAGSRLVTPPKRPRQLNSCDMGELRVHRDLTLGAAMVTFHVRQRS
jgi:hypothetical protein